MKINKTFKDILVIFVLICLGFLQLALIINFLINIPTFLLIILITNYLFTIYLSVKLISNQKISNLITNFYLFMFLFLPVIGIVIYWFFGHDFSDKKTTDFYKKIINKLSKNEVHTYTEQFINDPLTENEKVYLYNYKKNNQPIYLNNKISLLSSPSEHIVEKIKLINKATKFINIEYYIFHDGHVLDYLLYVLKKKINEGVEVKLLIDDLANFKKLKKKTKKKIREIGIKIKFFNPIFSFGKTWWQFRNHNKFIVVDNKYAIYGSCNISDEYYNITSDEFQTTELSIIIEGEIVNSLNNLFLSHWNITKNKSNSQNLFENNNNLSPLASDGQAIMQLVNSAPLLKNQIIKNNLIQLIYSAQKSIIISTPYFFPPKDILTALINASVSGVKVIILVPKQADFSNFFLRVNRQPFKELIKANVKIYEYFGFNHQKISIIDDDIVYFGSYNIDYRALYLNFESVVLIKDLPFADLSKNFLEKQIKNSYQITKKDLISSKNFFNINIFISGFIWIMKPFL